MSYMLPHLHNGWQVDQAILSEEDRVVVIRFGHDWDPTCMKMDEVLYSIAEKVKNFAVIYLVDITEVPDFNKMYELYDPCTVMFFFRYLMVLERSSVRCFAGQIRCLRGLFLNAYRRAGTNTS
ncbi:thioredoxin-like protein 4A isoform 2-T2 [Leptosomus discolor]